MPCERAWCRGRAASRRCWGWRWQGAYESRAPCRTSPRIVELSGGHGGLAQAMVGCREVTLPAGVAGAGGGEGLADRQRLIEPGPRVIELAGRHGDFAQFVVGRREVVLPAGVA